MDLSQIFAQSLLTGGVGGDPALNAFEKTINQNNYWNMAAAPVLGMRFNTSTWNPGTTLAATAGQSFLGAMLQGLGAQSNARQIDAVTQRLPEIYANPGSITSIPGVDSEALAGLNVSAARENILRGAKQQELQQSVIADLFGKRAAAALDIEAAGPKALAQEKAKLDAMGLTSGGLENNPDSPQGKALKAIKEEEDARRKEIGAIPIAVSLQNTLASLPALETLAKQDTKTSDIPFTYKLITGFDGGVVKDGERYMIQGGNSFVQQYKSMLEGALNGTSQLTPKLKAQMVNEMKMYAKSQADSLAIAAKPILDVGTSRKGDAAKMYPFPDSYLSSVLTPMADVVDPANLASSLSGILAKAQKGEALSASDEAIIEAARKSQNKTGSW